MVALARNEQRFQPALFIFGRNVSDDGDDKRAYGIDDEIAHGIDDRCAAYQRHAVFQGIFLHIQLHEPIDGKLVNFPDGAQHHGKAKREKCHEDGAEVGGDAVAIVEQRNDGKAERTQHAAAKAVQNGIPVGYLIVEILYFAQV